MYNNYKKNIFMHLSQYEKKYRLLIDLSKCLKIMHHHALFSELCKLCTQSWIMWFHIAHNSGSPEEDNVADVSNTSKRVSNKADISSPVFGQLNRANTQTVSFIIPLQSKFVPYQLDCYQIFTSHLQAVTLEGTLCFWTDFWSGDHKPKKRKSKHGAFMSSTLKFYTLTT